MSSNPVYGDQGSLISYLGQIKKFPMLSSEEEYMLARRWLEREDQEAAHKLITSHLRLVAKVANGYRGYGLPLGELIAEGNIGLMHAIRKFDPDKGFRLSTYALWWIKAMIQEYILRSWSLVKVGTTKAQKKLFFSLKKIKKELGNVAEDHGDLTPIQIKEISKSLQVDEGEITSMEQRLKGGDLSLNAPVTMGAEGEQEEWQDWLQDETPNAEKIVLHYDEFEKRKKMLQSAMETLNSNEQFIIKSRRLADVPLTLEVIADELSLSKERVRQIEMKAFEKLQKHMVS